MSTLTCRICGSQATFLFHARVLKRYQVRFFWCPQCSFVQTEEPYWLEQAYREPIGDGDTWNIERSIYCANLVKTLLPLFKKHHQTILDYGAGYGIMVRLLRNAGITAYWYDQYAPNLFAREYQWHNLPIDLITCFEVFEHFAQPLKELEKLLKISRTILFSTVLIPSPPPPPSEWDYFSLDGGQHVAFYSLHTLQYLARTYNLRLYSNRHNLHILTDHELDINEELATYPAWDEFVQRIETTFSPHYAKPSLLPIPSHEDNQDKFYGIAIFHALGDILNATVIARQIKTNDPKAHIVWYTAQQYKFILDGNPYIDEVVALDGNPHKLDKQITTLHAERQWHAFYTPAPYLAYDKLPGGDLTELMLASIDMPLTVPLRPVLVLRDDEVESARRWWSQLPADRPRILVETEFHSAQSPWDDSYVTTMVETLGKLNPVFVFTAKNRPPFLDSLKERYRDVVWCNLPFRLNAELYNLCDAFIGVASGISCLTNSTWCHSDVPSIEVVSGPHWSTWHYTHRTRRRICFDRVKFEQALQWLYQVLKGIVLGNTEAESLIELYTHRREGKYRWLSPALLPTDIHQLADSAVYSRILRVLQQVGNYYLCYGGIGDFLLALSTAMDRNQPITVVTYPNSTVVAQAFFDALPQVNDVIIIPRTGNSQHDNNAGLALRRATLHCTHCLGRGVTPPEREDDFWKLGLDVERDCGVKRYPEWIRHYNSEKVTEPQVVVAPMGSNYGTFRSKRNIIPPHYWKPLLSLLHTQGVHPVIIGTPDEAEGYPAEPWCYDQRSYSFEDQFRVLASADLVIAADSWHKTFSAMAMKPTIVCSSVVNHDLTFWQDSSNVVFIKPWPNIHLVKSWYELIEALSALWVTCFGTELKISSEAEHLPRQRPQRTNHHHPLTSFHPILWERPYQHVQTAHIRIPDAVGDTLMMTAIVHSMKQHYPHLSITIAGGMAARDIFHGNRDVECITDIRSPRALHFEAESDIVVDYSYLLDVIPEYYGIIPMMDLLANIAGIRLNSKNLVYSPTDAEIEWADEYSQRIWNDRSAIALHLETNKDPLRTYPHQQKLLEILLRQLPSTHFVWLGSKPAPIKAPRLTDCAQLQYSLRQQIALARKCDTAIVIDSVFFHVLHNLWRKPTILLAGPTSQYLIGNPSAAPLHTLRASDCIACYWNMQRCKRCCMYMLDPSSVASDAAMFMHQIFFGPVEKSIPRSSNVIQCQWDPLQHNLYHCCLDYRNNGSGPVRLEIIEQSYPLPPYAHLWNGVDLIRTQTRPHNVQSHVEVAA